MLSVTCDAFIHTLDECVKLAVGNPLILHSPSSNNEQPIARPRKSTSEFDQPKFVDQIKPF